MFVVNALKISGIIKIIQFKKTKQDAKPATYFKKQQNHKKGTSKNKNAYCNAMHKMHQHSKAHCAGKRKQQKLLPNHNFLWANVTKAGIVFFIVHEQVREGKKANKTNKLLFADNFLNRVKA